MAVLVERRISSAAGWSRRLAWFSAVLFAVAGIGHRFGLLETIAFFWILAIIGILAVAALTLAATSFPRIWNFGDGGARDAATGTTVALVVLAPFLFSGYCVFAYPQLHDLATDLTDPPLLTLASQQRGPGMNAITGIDEESAALQQEHYPEIVGRRYDLPLERSAAIVDSLVKLHRWKALAASSRAEGGDPDSASITREFLAGSPVLGFPANVAIRLIEEDGSTYVDMRSASLYGRHDFGDNARRIVSFLEEMDAQVALQAGIAVPEAPDQ
jgi:hypothetical protein